MSNTDPYIYSKFRYLPKAVGTLSNINRREPYKALVNFMFRIFKLFDPLRILVCLFGANLFSLSVKIDLLRESCDNIRPLFY